jgi:abortive infection bacteriophage resistance protein
MKPAKSLDDQIGLMSSRGLTVQDATSAKKILHNLNYYRLSGYMREFQINPSRGNNKFHPGTDFDEIIAIYHFDQRLRDVLGTGLSLVEVAFRSRLAYAMAMAIGPDGYLDERHFSRSQGKNSDDSVAFIEAEIKRSKEKFVAHHRDRLNEDFPIWVAVETLSFGTISKLHSSIKDPKLRSVTAKTFDLAPAKFPDLIHHMSYFRNLCSHHSRLWNREMTVRVPHFDHPAAVARRLAGVGDRCVYRSLVWLNYLVGRVDTGNDFGERVLEVFRTDPSMCAAYGFPSGHKLDRL